MTPIESGVIASPKSAVRWTEFRKQITQVVGNWAAEESGRPLVEQIAECCQTAVDYVVEFFENRKRNRLPLVSVFHPIFLELMERNCHGADKGRCLRTAGRNAPRV